MKKIHISLNLWHSFCSTCSILCRALSKSKQSSTSFTLSFSPAGGEFSMTLVTAGAGLRPPLGLPGHGQSWGWPFWCRCRHWHPSRTELWHTWSVPPSSWPQSWTWWSRFGWQLAGCGNWNGQRFKIHFNLQILITFSLTRCWPGTRCLCSIKALGQQCWPWPRRKWWHSWRTGQTPTPPKGRRCDWQRSPRRQRPELKTEIISMTQIHIQRREFIPPHNLLVLGMSWSHSQSVLGE